MSTLPLQKTAAPGEVTPPVVPPAAPAVVTPPATAPAGRSWLEGYVIPGRPEIGKALKDWAPLGLGVGIGGAALVNLAAHLNRVKKQNLDEEPKTDDVMEIQLPTKKVAGLPNTLLSGILQKIQGAIQATKASSAVTATIPEAQAMKSGVRNLAENVGKTLKSPHGYVPAGMATATGGLALLRSKLNEAARASGKLPASSDSKARTNLLLQSGLATAAFALPALAAYHGTDALVKKVRTSQADEELDQAKGEYENLLGESLTGPASVKTASFPYCEEFVRTLAGMTAGSLGIPVDSTCSPDFLPELNQKSAGGFGEMVDEVIAPAVSIPSAVAVLAGIAAHKLMYSREKALDAAMNPKKIKPPTAVRLTRAPAPVAAPVPAEEEEKAAVPA